MFHHIKAAEAVRSRSWTLQQNLNKPNNSSSVLLNFLQENFGLHHRSLVWCEGVKQCTVQRKIEKERGLYHLQGCRWSAGTGFFSSCRCRRRSSRGQEWRVFGSDKEGFRWGANSATTLQQLIIVSLCICFDSGSFYLLPQFFMPFSPFWMFSFISLFWSCHT